MKKKVVMMFLTMMMAASLAACGGEAKDPVGSGESVVGESTGGAKEDKEEKKEDKEAKKEDKEMELPNWKGVKRHVGFIATELVDGEKKTVGNVDVDILYPSLKPTTSGWAYQWDPAMIWVGCPDDDENGNVLRPENIEDAFSTVKRIMLMELTLVRNHQYEDKTFDFVIESQEVVTVGDFETCKYTGMHTYTKDDVACQIPFVAYGVDTNQVENGYIVVLVMDDSQNNPSMDPLPEGTIEAYAKKMVESIKLSEY